MMMNAARIASTGLAVESRRMAVSADAVANVNTDGYRAKEVVAEERAEGGVGSSVREQPGESPVAERDGARVFLSNTSVARETVTRIQASRAFQANLAVIRTSDQMTQSLLDIVG
ncbi:MAG: flagellar basal body rod protein [Deltaproteobacteria bacterium]|nr:flagellar basal body rod protein [Deltaproteobacteria bacterium]